MIIVQNFGHVQNKNYTLQPWYTLRTRIVSFSGQEKVVQKVDVVRPKILINARNQNAKY